MPDTYDEKKLWIDVIEKSYGDTQFRGFGTVCSLHFSSTDIENVTGRVRLKNGAVPMLTWCEKCVNLNSRLDEEKQLNIRSRLNNSIELHGKNHQIEKLTQKCSDQLMQIAALKAKVADLEKNKKEFESKNRKLEEQVVQHYGVANIDVIT